MPKTLRWKLLLCAAVMVPVSTLDTVRGFAQALSVEHPLHKQGNASFQDHFETEIVNRPYTNKLSSKAFSKHGKNMGREDSEEALRKALAGESETLSVGPIKHHAVEHDTRNIAKLDVKTPEVRGRGDSEEALRKALAGESETLSVGPIKHHAVEHDTRNIAKLDVKTPEVKPEVKPEVRKIEVSNIEVPKKVSERTPQKKIAEEHQVVLNKTISEEHFEKKLALKQASSTSEHVFNPRLNAPLNSHMLTRAAFAAEKARNVEQGARRSLEKAPRIQISDESVSQSTAPHGVEDELVLQAGMGRIVLLKRNVSRLFSADSKLVVVHSAGPRSFFVFGLKPGNTVIEAVSSSGERVARYAVKVTPSQYQSSVLKNGVAAKSPHVRVEPLPDGVALEGEAPNPEAAQKIIDRTRSMVGANGYVADYMKVPGSIQVNLHVRILEMDRSLVRDFGINWQSINTLGNMALIGVLTEGVGSIAIAESANKLSSVFTALATDGLVRNLAEPNLTTISGQPASFLVGGEFPVPISNYTGTPMISFKPYGIELDFVPTVLANGQISLHVRPSVSALDYSTGGYTVKSMNTNSSMIIPGITMRRADTTVELGSGQSFVIAGLLQDVASMDTSGMPWLKNIPILGSLFKSSNFKDNMSELVIIVTPYLVKPVNNEREFHTPDEDWRPPRGVDQVFLMHQSQTDVSKRQPWQKVDVNNVGFIME